MKDKACETSQSHFKATYNLVVMHTCNTRTWQAEARDHKASQSYIKSSRLTWAIGKDIWFFVGEGHFVLFNFLKIAMLWSKATFRQVVKKRTMTLDQPGSQGILFPA